jgi:hypothetical protein
MSIEMWLRPAALTTANTVLWDSGPSAVFGPGTGPFPYRSAFVNPSQGQLSSAMGSSPAAQNIGVAVGASSHIVVVRTATQLFTYLDGSPGAQPANVSTFSSVGTQGVLLGSNAKMSNGVSFNGAMQEFAMYDHPLSAGAIAEHFRIAVEGS